MKKFNLFNEIIIADKSALYQAINSSKEFAITHTGEIIYDAFEDSPVIYKGKVVPIATSALSPQKPHTLNEIIGNNYKIVEDDDRVLIKAGAAWQDIINFNIRNCDYDDSSGDGISVFSDNALEDMGWQATEFNVEYRDMVDIIEAKCDGIILCIEQEEPYQFSGLGFISDIECARSNVYAFCKKRISEKIENDSDFAKENLTDDEKEAAAFFEVL